MNIDDDFYDTDVATGEHFEMILGDSCEELPKMAAETVDLSIHSPPFASLYTYSPTSRDIGNSADLNEYLTHYSFIARELLRVTKPGRVCVVHIKDVAKTKVMDGVIGLTDLSGAIIRMYEEAGWVYQGRITIRKNPQTAAYRTHSVQLAFTTLRRDRSVTMPVVPEYILKFRAPGENEVPIDAPLTDGGDYADNTLWIKWAEAIWDDIVETNTLNVAMSREREDERHICPLPLDLIERCVRLWSNPGEHVLSPCAGIGSEGYVSLQLGRTFTGVELKRSYWVTAVDNLKKVEAEMGALTLFDTLDA